MLDIHEFCYRMFMVGGFQNDRWLPYGYCPTHPNTKTGYIFTSTPAAFDAATDTLTTASGRKYKILSYNGNRDEIIAQIELDIKFGTECH